MVHPDQREALPLFVKKGTHDAHENLEARLQPRLADLPNAEAYAQLLRTFYGFYQPLESAIENLIPAASLPDLSGRRKASWIGADLEELRMDNDERPIADELPALQTEADAWGALYVLEGSTLGGRLICRMLDAQLPGLPKRFFSGYGAETGPRWTGFLDAFTKAGEYLDYNAVLHAANATFKSFDLWLQKEPASSRIA